MTATLTIETFPNEAAAAYIRGKAVADPKNFGALPDQLKQRVEEMQGTLQKVSEAKDKVVGFAQTVKEFAESVSNFFNKVSELLDKFR